MNIQTITNVSDCVPLYLPHSLYLKPLAKFYISVSLPVNKLGKTISNYDIMDKLKSAIKPDNFLVLKVSKSTLEFIRFEAELDDRTKLRGVLARLDGRPIKLSGFNDPFKVRASEPKDEFPSRHDWDSFFRDAKNMDEMKPGERPDTLHISNLPIRWFCPRHMENDQNVKPSENIFKRIFEKFGSVRCVDIPICDPYRSQMKTEITGMKTFNFDQEIMFEGYVQFSEYVGFVRAMDEFRGMKLIRKMGDKNQAVNISVTFDKTKHLSDSSAKRRTIVRDRLIAKERAKEDEEIKKKKEEEEKLEKERKTQEELKLKELEKQREREEKRKEKHLKKLKERGQLELTQKIKQEERKLLIAQRKLESIRILEAVFERLKLKEVQTKSSIKTTKKDKHHSKNLSAHDLRNKLVDKYKNAHEKIFVAHKNKLEKQKEKLGQVGEKGLHIFLDGDKKRDSSPSVNTISSGDSVLSDSKIDLKRKIKKEKDLDLSDSDSENEKTKKTKMPNMNPFGALYNPEMAGEWLPMGMYPYGPLFTGIPAIRPGYFPPNLPYRNFPFRGRSRGRGRGSRNRGSQYSNSSNYPYDNEQYYKYYKKISGHGDGGYADEHDRRSSTYSRSSSRSRSRSRHSKTRYSRTKSKSRSKRRSRSRSRSRHSRSRSKTRNKPRHKLVSTRRSRSVSSSRSRSSRTRSRSRSWSKTRNSKETLALQPSKLIRSAKEIQRSVQQKLHERQQEEEQKKKSQSSAAKTDTVPSTSKKRSQSRSRSASIDSSKFKSPKRKKSLSEDEWN